MTLRNWKCSTALARKDFTFLHDSKPSNSYFKEVKFNISSEEQEIEDISFNRCNESISEEDWNKTEAQLGKELTPNPVWHPIKQKITK